MNIYLLAILLYLSALAAVGYWHSRRPQTGDDFLVAGRRLPAHVLVFTLLSTWIGSGSLFGSAGLGYRAGLPALWQSAGAWLGIAAVFFIASRVRRMAHYTVPDILTARFGTTAGMLASIVIVIAYTTIAGYQFRGGGRLLALVSGIDPLTGAIVTAAFCIAFTTFAGMSSVAHLDVANGVMMIVGVAVAVIYLLGDAGGMAGVTAALRPDQLTLFGVLSPRESLALFLPTLLLLLGEANMYQKFFSARDGRTARVAVAGWIVGTITVESLVVAIGLLGSLAIAGLSVTESETIVVRVALDVLPAALGLLLLAGAASIIVSTANSMLLTPATSLVRDVYQRSMNPAATDAQIVLYTRIAIAALGTIAVIVGGLFPTILAMALWAYTMYGAGITPALLAALLWPRATPEAAVGSILAGGVTTIVWEVAGLTSTGYPLGINTVYPALLASVGTLVAVRGR